MSKRRAGVFDPNCESRQVLALLADRWSMLIIFALRHGVRRHGELKRTLDGVSQKMLTHTLRSLERDGLVRRRAYQQVPPRVEYSLTPLGRTLLGPLGAICSWAERYLPKVRAARHAAG